MTVIDKKIRRDVVPRWHLSGSEKGALHSLPAKKNKAKLLVANQQDVSDLLREFDETGKPMIAAEALSSAITLGDYEAALKAASRLSNFDLTLMPALRSLVSKTLKKNEHKESTALSICDRDNEEKSRALIKKYKKMVRVYPRSPLAWLDLAFSYVAVGQIDKARDAVVVATTIDSNNRGVVRSASRFFVHSGEFDRALSILSKSNLLKIDPWIVSAHIATSRAYGKSSALIGAGRKMFKDENFRKDQISELGAALATNEFEHGNVRLAEKMVDKLLISPTENAVAQVAWLETIENKDFQASEIALNMPNAWEARTVEAFEKKNWKKTCEEAALWLTDQPFSTRPAVHGSYVASTFLDDYPLALIFSEAGYRANPKDSIVANNYAVSLAQVGRVEEARRIFSECIKEAEISEKPFLFATNGLILYREGDINAARSAYDYAKTFFSSKGDFRSQILATIYQAREESRLENFSETISLLVEITSQADKETSADSSALREIAIKFIEKFQQIGEIN